MLLERYHYQIFADYFQFYVEDENFIGEADGRWSDPKSLEIGLDSQDGSMAVGTERNYPVLVDIEIHDSEPKEDLSVWDRVNECSMHIPSGVFVVFGCTDYRPEAARIRVNPGIYRARVYSGGLETVVEFDQGKDHYRVALWPAPIAELKILKSRKPTRPG